MPNLALDIVTWYIINDSMTDMTIEIQLKNIVQNHITSHHCLKSHNRHYPAYYLAGKGLPVK